jgi:hypothetical protein
MKVAFSLTILLPFRYLTKYLGNFMEPFEAVTESKTSVFQLRAEDNQLGMDCLSVRKINGVFYGVYHNLNGSDIFDLYVARSSDLLSWTNSNVLFRSVSMGKFVEAWGGILLVAEHGNPCISVGVAFYSSVDKFAAGSVPIITPLNSSVLH